MIGDMLQGLIEAVFSRRTILTIMTTTMISTMTILTMISTTILRMRKLRPLKRKRISGAV